MRVMVVGASGAIGTRLVPQLSERGHKVIGTFRSPGKAERLRALGARPVVLDLLDSSAVHKAVIDVHPAAVVGRLKGWHRLRRTSHPDLRAWTPASTADGSRPSGPLEV